VKKECKKQIDELEKALDDTSIVGIITGALDVASCIVENIQDIIEQCNPFEVVEFNMLPVAPIAKSEDKCHHALYSACGKELDRLKSSINDASVFGMWGSGLEVAGCVTEHAEEIVKGCVGQEKSVLALSGSSRLGSEGQCHKTLYGKCGKELHALKHSIEDTSINGILSSSLAVASCITANFLDIVKGCNPLEAKRIADEMFAIQEPKKESPCHKELYKQCGEDIKGLKEGIQNTAVLEIVGSSLALQGCVIRNSQDLLKMCMSKPVQDQEVALQETVHIFYHEYRPHHGVFVPILIACAIFFAGFGTAKLRRPKCCQKSKPSNGSLSYEPLGEELKTPLNP
jgi:hypothetical protein